jgi:hypothetical protein
VDRLDELRDQLIPRMLRCVLVALAVSASAIAACGPTPETSAAQQTASVVDSAVPRDVALTRFRECCGRVDSLSGGAPSRDALVRRFVHAIETKDTASLRELLLTRSEFAWLHYDTSPQGLPPYNLSPALMWFLLEGNGAKGLGRALDEYGGKPLGYLDYRCDEKTSVEGENTLWGPCAVRRVEPDGDTVQVRLFGLLIERGGRWKFLNYSNKL